jgi:hypothetical protein
MTTARKGINNQTDDELLGGGWEGGGRVTKGSRLGNSGDWIMGTTSAMAWPSLTELAKHRLTRQDGASTAPVEWSKEWLGWLRQERHGPEQRNGACRRKTGVRNVVGREAISKTNEHRNATQGRREAGTFQPVGLSQALKRRSSLFVDPYPAKLGPPALIEDCQQILENMRKASNFFSIKLL